MQPVFANGIKTRLNGALTDSALTATVNDGSVFPSLSGDQVIVIKITKATTGAFEVMHITGISTNDLTIERGKEGTTAIAFDNGDDVEMVITSDILLSLQRSFRPVNEITAATHTLTISNAAQYLLCSEAGGCTITVPPQSSVEWPDSCEIHGRGSAEATTFSEGSGVTINVPAGFDAAAAAGAAWALKRESEDIWALSSSNLSEVAASPAFIAASSNTADTTSLTVSHPAGIAEGDLMVGMFTAISDVTAPSGWTVLEDYPNTDGIFLHYVVCYKVVEPSDVGASSSASISGGEDASGGIIAFSEAGTPLLGGKNINSGDSANFVCPELSSNQTNSAIISLSLIQTSIFSFPITAYAAGDIAIDSSSEDFFAVCLATTQVPAGETPYPSQTFTTSSSTSNIRGAASMQIEIPAA